MNKNIFLRIFCLVVFAIFFQAFNVILIFAREQKMFGGENGWGEIYSADGIEIGKGKFGFDCVELQTNKAQVFYSTDLLVSFDDDEIKDETGNYRVVECGLVPTKKSIMGKSACISRGAEDVLVLEAKDSAIFGNKGMIGSFGIEFWLAPATSENGETVFLWNSSINATKENPFQRNAEKIYAEYQMISAVFFNNHIEWEFSNVFAGYKDISVTLSGKSTIVPEKWSRHSIFFDEETGLFEYKVDGRTEDLKFITEDGHEGSTICPPILGVKANLYICSNYVGRIDDLKIERDPKKIGIDFAEFGLYATGNEKFKVSGGRFSLEPIFVPLGATLDSVEAIFDVPSETAIRFFVRGGTDFYNWTNSNPQWQEIALEKKIENVNGTYFQFAAELLPDGAGIKTPSITEITLNYTEESLPLPPFFVEAQSGDGCVTLTWNRSVDESAGGYRIFYGNRSGEYLGSTAAQGASPVKAGTETSFTLSGLQNGKIYYFAIATSSKNNEKILGPLSKEVFARPGIVNVK